jgi:hypothetical protein
MIQSEISLCRVYKRSGIDDTHGQSSSSTQFASSARRTSSRTGAPTVIRHGSSPSPSSTPLSPTQQLSSFHLLQGECSSASPPAPMMDQVVTVHSAPQQLLTHPSPCTYAPATTISISTAEAVPEWAQGAEAAFASSYSLFNMAAAAGPMAAGSSRSSVDELSTLVGHSQAYANLSAATGGHLLPLLTPPPPPMLQTMPLGALPIVAPPSSSVADKLSWDWNQIPDTTGRDYNNTSGFKWAQNSLLYIYICSENLPSV